MTREQVARTARRAEAAGQLGLACLLMSVAGNMDPDDLLGLPSAEVTADAIARGNAIDLSADGRRGD